MTTATDTTLRDLIRRIVTRHHGYLRQNLPAIAASISETGELELGAAFEQLRSELMDHLNKEEALLFPAIDRIESALAAGEPLPKPYLGSMNLPVQILKEEHRIADDLLARIRDLTRNFTVPAGPIASALSELDADLREHIRLETEELFPQALELQS